MPSCAAECLVHSSGAHSVETRGYSANHILFQGTFKSAEHCFIFCNADVSLFVLFLVHPFDNSVLSVPLNVFQFVSLVYTFLVLYMIYFVVGWKGYNEKTSLSLKDEQAWDVQRVGPCL